MTKRNLILRVLMIRITISTIQTVDKWIAVVYGLVLYQGKIDINFLLGVNSEKYIKLINDHNTCESYFKFIFITG